MRHEEAELVVGPVVGVQVKVVDDVDDVERQPGHAEYGDHGDQHPVGPALPLAILLLALAGLAAGFGARPIVELDRHAHVAEGDHEERHDELQYRSERAEDLAERLAGPVFLTEGDDLRGHFLRVLHVQPVRQGDQQRDHPDAHDDRQAHLDLHARMERIEDHEEPVDGYARQRERADVHADRLGVGHQVAQGLAEDPAVEEGVQGGEGHGQHAQQHVAEREIGDEEIGDGVHLPVPPDDEDHQHVAEYTEHEDDDVEQAEQDLDRQIRRHVVGLVAGVARRQILHGDQDHRRRRRYLRCVVIHGAH